MTTKQKALAWGMGILVWINLLSILLSIWQFGYVDWATVAHMGMIILPLLFVGTFLLYQFRMVTTDRQDETSERERVFEAEMSVGARR
ncbi:MAG: hypothetical protein HY731_00400 [Candidatus Tectomicrobia bacterium]|nr:hypothetical protein [Candidatus Tectomicrobia bacterium]